MSYTKFMRNYRLVVYAPVDAILAAEWKPTDYVVIDYPISIDFDIDRGVGSSLFARGSFSVYNLSAQTRRFLFHDIFDVERFMRVQFFAGYGDSLKLLFDGKITTCYSSRQGVDIVTQIVAQEMAPLNPFISLVFPKGTKKSAIIKTVIGNYLSCKSGTISLTDNQDVEMQSDYTAEGSAYFLLNKMTEGKWFQTGQTINVLQDNDTLTGLIQQLTPETGLINTPRRANQWLEADMIFTPEMVLGQRVKLADSIEPVWNGDFKVNRMHHSGNISPTKAGRATTKLQLTRIDISQLSKAAKY